jgi:hypothetical protein
VWGGQIPTRPTRTRSELPDGHESVGEGYLEALEEEGRPLSQPPLIERFPSPRERLAIVGQRTV